MIVKSATSPAIVMSDGKPSSFRIKEDKKTFKAFSDGLYSDKVGSIIRELSSNAVDIHNEINNKEPFDIFLPCEGNPYFSIRDYGTGLSPEQFDSLYTVIGESTKDNENDSIGGFGLGSKTPFAYVDQYFVRSYFNNIVYTYCFFFSEDEPQYLLTSKTETKEKNGLEIFFLVEPSDFLEFESKAKNILPWFSIIPNVFANTKEENGFFSQTGETINIRESIIENHKEDILFENDFFYIHKKQYLNNISFEQGGVVYSLGTNTYESMEFLNSISHLFNYQLKIIFKAKIGDLEIQRSRESLSLSKKITIPAINSILKNVLIDAEKSCSPLFDNYDNLNEFNKKKLIFTFKRPKYSSIFQYSKINNMEILNFYIHVLLNNIEHIDNDNLKRIISEDIKTSFRIRNHEICNISTIKGYSYTRNGFKKIKCEKDIALFNYDEIKVIFRDGYKINIFDLFKHLNISNNDFVFLVEVKPSLIKEDKTSFFEKTELSFLKYFQAGKGDINFLYESKEGIVKEKISPSIVKKRNSYANSINYLTKYENIEKIRNISVFKDKNVLILQKKGVYANYNGIETDRNTAMKKAFIAAVANGIDGIDYVVCANKRETSEIIDHAAKTYLLNDLSMDKKINSDFDSILSLKEEYSLLENKEKQMSDMSNKNLIFYKYICKYLSIDNEIEKMKKEKLLIKEKISEKQKCLIKKYNIHSFFEYSYFINEYFYLNSPNINYYNYESSNYKPILFKKTIPYKVNKIIEKYPILKLLSFHGVSDDEIEKCLFSYFEKIKLKKTLF